MSVLPQPFLQKSLDSQKSSLDMKKITIFKISALKLTAYREIIRVYLVMLLPKNLKPICKFVKIDLAEAWKILARKPSGCFEELKVTRLTKYFRSINLTFKLIYFGCTDPARK